MSTGHSDTTTEGIRIRVGAKFLPQESRPEAAHWRYIYRVRIDNEGDRSATLRSRHWIIRDANNRIDEVRGDGVVGEQPELPPGGHFEYVSSCPLGTAWGTMEGSYTLERENGERFDAVIGRFFLAPNVAPLEELVR